MQTFAKHCAPSLQRLMDDLHLDAHRAIAIRHIWRAPTIETAREYAPQAVACAMRCGLPRVEARLAAIDSVLETHGVEYLGKRRRDGADIHYCNAGDAYAATIVRVGSSLFVASWGDLVESPRYCRTYNRFTGECE